MSQAKSIDISSTIYVPVVTLADASGNPYVAGSATAPTVGTQTSVASSASDTTILASNTLRKGAFIYNDSTSILYLLVASGTSSTTNYTVQIVSGGSLSIRVGEYTGVIKGIWASANGFARVTEYA